MKIGLFFGSFNPVHVGHLIIASYFVDYCDLDQVWFIVSPQNPFKKQSELLNEYERLNLVNIAIEDDARFRASDIEFHLTRPSYTINTLLHLEEKYPEHKWSLIMGSDTYDSLPKWKNYDKLTKDYSFLIYPRPNQKVPHSALLPNAFLAEDVPLMEISASFIRKMIREKNSYRYLVSDPVYKYIDKWGLFL